MRSKKPKEDRRRREQEVADFERQVEAARRFMTRYRNALRELAQGEPPKVTK